MGTDLYQLGNHKIQFAGKNFGELAAEIKSTLDKIEFSNQKFLKHVAFQQAKSGTKDVRAIREIKTKREWTFAVGDEYHNFEKDGEIDFYGPYLLQLTFDENKIWFWDPSLRYRQWLEMDDDAVYRDEWRKYMQQVVTAFGGNRVVYLADNNHPLDEFTYHKGTFEELENALMNKFGPSKSTFQEVADNTYDSYLIDDFSSIDWSNSEQIDENISEPDETSSTDYDLKLYSEKENLKELRFSRDVLIHKLIGNQLHFCHLAHVQGLLCVQTGIVGGQENLEVTLDAYAPFIFDSMEEKLKAEGYGNQHDKKYVIKLDNMQNFQAWKEAIYKFCFELKWHGIGMGLGFSTMKGYREQWFDAVDESLALQLLIQTGKQYNVAAKIEVYRIDGNEFETLIYRQ